MPTLGNGELVVKKKGWSWFVFLSSRLELILGNLMKCITEYKTHHLCKHVFHYRLALLAAVLQMHTRWHATYKGLLVQQY